ncbi:MAG: DUF3604 domain-containing protein [Halioglobus sp.]|nr:DUF3604 domain-containing protein [Halioglobus sp.]
MIRLTTALLLSTALLAACGDDKIAPQDATPEARATSGSRMVNYTQEREPCDHYTQERIPLWGDTHVHTTFSFDAAANTIGVTPVDANNYARGEAIPFWPLNDKGEPAGTYKIDRPLDFLAVTDHGEFLGERRLCREEGSPSYDTQHCTLSRQDERTGMLLLAQSITSENPDRIPEICGADGQLCRDFAQGPWEQMAEAAAAANDDSSDCTFTSFVAYEYTGTPETSNYHRNVIFRNQNVPGAPVSYIDAPYDSALWEGLDAVCTEAGGCDYLTIPHNSNLANGRMQPYRRIEQTRENHVAYALKRQQREPIIEMFQHKGNSECVNGLSTILGPPDELCDMEAVRLMGREETFAGAAGQSGTDLVNVTEVTKECAEGEVGANGMVGGGCIDATDFIRSGLVVGLKEENRIGENPMKLGMIGASDTHTATPGSVMEDDWRGHVTGEGSPEERLQPGLLTSGIDGNPGGLAGVWAMENSRDAIFEAMLRREVWGTSGPRIVPRFFAGWGFDENLCKRDDMVAAGYAGGVPMGGDLASPGNDAKLTFIASALRDSAEGATPLQKLQLIKGWVDADGAMRSRVIDIAGGEGNHDSLCVVYTDNDFDPDLATYYYLRAVEHPVPRWHMYDCEKIAEDERPPVCTDGSYPETVQEMAWTSPIWYRPGG